MISRALTPVFHAAQAGSSDVAFLPRAALCYTIHGDLRFLSHRDELRMLARALARAAWPLRYSQGFNPQPRISIPLPRSVGTAAERQWAIVDLSEPADAGRLAQQLAPTLPGGCRLHTVTLPPGRRTPHPIAAIYEVELDPADLAEAARHHADLLSAATVPVERHAAPGSPARQVDIRPYIESLSLAGAALRMTLRIEQQRTARPAEVLTALGLAGRRYQHRVRRIDILWDIELSAPPARAPDAREREHLGNQED